MGVTKQQSTRKVQFKKRKVESKYQEILDAALKLKVGKSILVDVPEGEIDTVFRNRLSVAISKKVKPFLENDEQCVRLRCTDDNQVAISLIAYE